MASKRRTAAQKKKDSTSLTTNESQTLSRNATASLPTPNSKLTKGINADEFRQVFLENKRKKLGQKVSRKYTYLYSDNYQNIERLLVSSGRSFKARSTVPEFQVLEELCRKKIEKTRKVVAREEEQRETYLNRALRIKRGK